MPVPFENNYYLRRVAEHASKACIICYKPTKSVLVSADGKSDFFYICDAHLKDASFATPQLSADVQQAKARQEELNKEIELVKKQWAEYQKKKKKKDDEKKKKKDEEKSKDKEDEKSKETDEKNDTASPEDKLNKLEDTKTKDNQLISAEPRQFILNRDIYNLRLGHWRSKQTAKQTRKILQQPNLFPKVPTHVPKSDQSKKDSGNTS